MAGRAWREYEREAVRQFYGRIDTAVLADRLGRTARAVRLMALALRLTADKFRHIKALSETVRAGQAAGESDATIAKREGVARETVMRVRRYLGLPSNRFNATHKAKLRDGMKRQLGRRGLKSAGCIRLAAWRERAKAAGWPEDLKPRHVQILNALWDHGPQTRKQLAALIGQDISRPSRRCLKSRDPEGSITGHLLARGLIVVIGMLGGGRGKGGAKRLYSLPLNIERGEVA